MEQNPIQLPHPHKTQLQVFPWLCHEVRKREPDTVSSLNDIHWSWVIDWRVPLYFFLRTSLACRHEKAEVLLGYPCYLFIIYLNPMTPTPLCLLCHSISHSYWAPPLFTSQFTPNFPLTSQSLYLTALFPSFFFYAPFVPLLLILSMGSLCTSVESWWIHLLVTRWYMWTVFTLEDY